MSVTREIRPGDARTQQRKSAVLEWMILVLTAHWLLSFFGQSILPGVLPSGGFIYLLALGIVFLIIVKFLS